MVFGHAMKSVIYARVSTKGQAEEGYSLPAQEKIALEYAERKGLEVVKKYLVPESASGKQLRKAFAEMMEYVRKNGIKEILVEKVDRMTRNFKEAVVINDWLDGDEERRVHFVKEGLVIHKNARSHEKFQWDIKIVLAQNYIRNLGEEVKKAHVVKLQQGWLPLFRGKYGYKNEKADGRLIQVVDEEYAPLIRKMFEYYATGQYSVGALVQKMHAEGLRTRKGERMGKTKMHVLLTDPYYYGTLTWNGKQSPGKHTPLIPRATFDRVQEVLERQRNGGPRKQKHDQLFKGLIRCKHCSGMYSWTIAKGHWYGYCNYYRKCEHRTFVRQEAVEAQIVPLLEQLSRNVAPYAEWLKEAMKENHQAEREMHDAAVAQLQKRHEQLQRRLDAIYEDKLDGTITKDMYDRKFKEYTEERELVVADLRRHDEANTSYFELASSIIDLASNAAAIYKRRSETQKREFLALAFSNLQMDREKLLYSYQKPLSLLAREGSLVEIRAGRDSNP